MRRIKTIETSVTIEIGLNEFTIPIDLNTRYTEESTKNVNTVTYKVNGGVVTLPFSVNNGDSLTFTVNKTDISKTSVVTLNGLLLS